MQSRRFGAGLFLGLCLFLSACDSGPDGSGSQTEPTTLPESVTITSEAQLEAGKSAQFSSDVADAPAGLRFHWEFGDGASSDESSPSHGFGSPGDYEVTFTLTNEGGESRSASQVVSVRRHAVVQGLQCSDGTSGWCWQNPRPMGNILLDFHFVDAQTGWAVGEAGQILKTVDGGQTWSAQASKVKTTLTSVRFASPTVGWAVGSSGTVLGTQDGGQTWTRQAVGGSRTDVASVEVLDEQRAIVVSSYYYYGARYTVDAGQTWTEASMRPDQVTRDGTLWRLEFGSLLKAAALGAEAPVISFGEQAQQYYCERFSMGDPSHGLLAASDYRNGRRQMFRTADAGAHWAKFEPTGMSPTVDYLKMFGDRDAWAVSDGGLYRSADGGSSWQVIGLPEDVTRWQLYDVKAYDARILWFSHEGGYYVTVDSGAHWTKFRAEASPESSASSLVRAGRGGWWMRYGDRIHHSVDIGASWTQTFGEAPEAQYTRLTDVWFIDSHRGLAASTGGWLMQTDDGGLHWQKQSLTGETSYEGSRLQFASSTLGWMSGHWGVSKSTDAGASWWTPVTDARLRSVSDFQFVDSSHGWAIAQDAFVFHSSDGGDSWTLLSTLLGVRGIRFIDEQVGVAIRYDGSVYRTADGGVTWSERPSDGYIYPERVYFSDPTTGWIVGGNGAVLVSRDAGLTWTMLPVPAPASVNLHDVRFADPLHGWIVGDQGLVMSTTDGGTSWAVQASGTTQSLYAAFFLDAYTGWAVGDSNEVIATATAGR